MRLLACDSKTAEPVCRSICSDCPQSHWPVPGQIQLLEQMRQLKPACPDSSFPSVIVMGWGLAQDRWVSVAGGRYDCGHVGLTGQYVCASVLSLSKEDGDAVLLS